MDRCNITHSLGTLHFIDLKVPIKSSCDNFVNEILEVFPQEGYRSCNM